MHACFLLIECPGKIAGASQYESELYVVLTFFSTPHQRIIHKWTLRQRF